ncbi:hypothetical protein WOC76_08685 [Methylocystis sp. IM3]|uniref:hypothetical protein n=1 Tax=unclassified Methylocystis TaxID=2625913 RepID=UPI000F9E1C5B|nr:MAG: Em GEA1 (EM1) [Hyphomicrobiales bacterium]
MAQRQTEQRPGKSGKGQMTVEQAGHLGGERGGKKGGERVKELIEEGKRTEGAGGAGKGGKSRSRH